MQILRYKILWMRILFKLDRMRQHGLLHNMKVTFNRALVCLFAVLMFPLSILVVALGYRRLLIFSDRIGHLSLEPDTILKEHKLGRLPQQKWIILAPPACVANQHLLDYWKPYFVICQSPMLCFLLEALTFWRFSTFNVAYIINRLKGAQAAYDVNAQWGDRPPLLRLTQQDEAFADKMLQELGIPKDGWFVCVHAREGGFSQIDESIHWHRNGDIENLMPSIEEITNRGGWVIRLGDPTTKPLKPMLQVVDYAHHPLRGPRLDVVLCARAKFILGNTSGIFLVGLPFGTPSALVNMIPFPTMGIYCGDISIPKLFRWKSNNRYLAFNEIMSSDISLYRYASLYKNSDAIIEDNSAEDILAVTKEMFARLDGTYEELPEDIARHDKYMSLFGSQHYSYRAGSKISFEFLRRHQDLLH